MRGGTRVEEVIEADLEDLRRGGIAGDVTTEVAIGLVGAHDHDERIPAHDGGEPFLKGEIARVSALPVQRDGVAVGREGLWQACAAAIA